MKVTSSIISFLVFILIIAIPPFILQHTGNDAGLMVSSFWTIFFFMSGLTFLVLIFTLILGNRNQEYLSQAFLGGTTFKILACLIFIFVLLSKNAQNKGIFLGDFVYVYLLNTLFEIYVLLRNLRHKNLR